MSGKSNPVIIRPDTKIGNYSAEADDEFLFECFIDHPALSTAEDIDSAHMFVSGRTGAGKTAILRMVEKNRRNTSEVELDDLSLSYIANSDIIRFIKSLDVDLDLFFQALWKHILCIEYIRLRFSVKNAAESKTFLQNIASFFERDERKKRAVAYLREWESKFWITMDENIKEITTKLEDQIEGSLKFEFQKFLTKAGYARTLSSEKRAEVTSRAKKIINADQLTDLSRVLELLSEYDASDRFKNKFYILIDRLDEKWVDESIRFQLIRALIESLRAFRKIKNLKVLVSIREDVLERVIQESTEVGFQREKYDDYFVRIVWRKDQLKKLVDKRINYLYRKKYTKDHVHFEEIFPHNVGQKNPFDYMIARTLYRPRDIISFVNICLSQAQGNSDVKARDIRAAEKQYSIERLQAMNQEWQSALPSLEYALPAFSKFGQRFQISSIATKEFVEDLVLLIAEKDLSDFDPVYCLCKEYMSDQSFSKIWPIAKLIVSELYRIGAIGVKMSSGDRYVYAHEGPSIIGPEMINSETKVCIHPMLHQALNIKD